MPRAARHTAIRLRLGGLHFEDELVVTDPDAVPVDEGDAGADSFAPYVDSVGRPQVRSNGSASGMRHNLSPDASRKRATVDAPLIAVRWSSELAVWMAVVLATRFTSNGS